MGILFRRLVLFVCVFSLSLPALAQESFYSLTKDGLSALTSGNLTRAESLLLAARDFAKKGERHRDYATSLMNVGLMYDKRGKIALSEEAWSEAISIYKEKYGNKSPEYAKAVNGLADLYFHNNKFKKATPLYEESVKIRSVSAFGHPDLADSCEGLGTCYLKTGRELEAAGLFKKAAAIQEEVYGKRNPRVAKSYFRLASSYDESGKTDMAIPVYKKAIDSCEAAYGANDLHTAVILEKLGLLYASTGKFKLAEGYFQQALTIRDSKPGKQADKLNQCLKDYASILRRENKTGDAEKLEARIKSADQLGIKKASPATSASNKSSK